MNRVPGFVLVLSLFLTTGSQTMASRPLIATRTAGSGHGDYDSLQRQLIRQWLDLNPKKYYRLTGHRMTLVEKISLKLQQRKVRRMIKKGKPVYVGAKKRSGLFSDFNLPGFALGMVLNIAGVVIAYLIDRTDADLIKWAWIGASISAVLILLAAIL